MTEEVSYTPEEVAGILKISRFTVYEMIKRGELQAYRIGRKMRIEAKDIEEYKRRAKGVSSSQGFLNTENQPTKQKSHHSIESNMSQPLIGQPVAPSIHVNEGFIICGQDIVLDVLTRHLDSRIQNIPILRNYVGSFSGLLAMYHGKANIATGHLWAGDMNEYNVPYVQRLLPGMNVVVINLVYRMAGFYVQKGNPQKITDWKDLIKANVRFINREKGCGARVLVDEKLKQYQIDRRYIIGYEKEEMSHLAVASAVARGDADVGVGIEKVAMQVQGIEFIPLQKERYDMVIRKEDLEKSYFKELVNVIRSQAFKQEVLGMGHYDVSEMGEIIAEV